MKKVMFDIGYFFGSLFHSFANGFNWAQSAECRHHGEANGYTYAKPLELE